MLLTSQPSDLGNILPITIAKCDNVLQACFNANLEVIRVYGWASTPDHNNGCCIDFMHYGNAAIRDFLINYLIENNKSLGVAGIIADRRVMGFPSNDTMYRGPEGVWRNYTGPNPHTDHVHVQFNKAAIGAETIQIANPSTTIKQLPLDQIARQVIAGSWGNGAERVQRLTNAGYTYQLVQAEVNRQLNVVAPVQKNVNEIATEVIQGKWGNGADRVNRLTAAGYNAQAVQAEVNRRLA